MALEESADNPRKRYGVFWTVQPRCRRSARNALMPALDAARRVFHPIDNRLIAIPDNVQFIAAVKRGAEFSGTFGIDAAQWTASPRCRWTIRRRREEVNPRASHPELPRGWWSASSPSPIAPPCAVARREPQRARHRGGLHVHQAPVDGTPSRSECSPRC